MPVSFVDAQSLADLRVFLERAEKLGASNVRLQVIEQALIATIPVLVGNGLTGLQLTALRISAIQSALAHDQVVAVRSVLERIAHLPVDATGPVEWPPASVSVPWAGIAPPRTGWQLVAEIELDYLRASAESTLGALATLTTTAPEVALAHALSQRDSQLEAPVGLAAAAQSLGFLIGAQPAKLATAGRWTRLSTAHGHVLSRG